MNFFKKLRDGLQKTRENTIDRIATLFGKNRIDETTLETLEEALLQADVGIDAIDELVESVRSRVKNNKDNDNNSSLHEILEDELLRLLAIPERNTLNSYSVKPWVVMIVGVNGSGKTTTIGKLAQKLSNEGKKVVIAAADTFRAAAIEQMEIWAQRSNARIVKQPHGADPGSVVFDAWQSAKARNEDVLLIDTAGRLQDNRNLMAELGKLTRVLNRLDASAPHEVLLIIDASTGQNGLSQAKGFSQSAPITGLIVTKLDGTARGGVVIPIQREMQVPVKFVGVGEGIDDLIPFNSEDYVKALIDN